MQTKVMNEGCACFVHHYIMYALYDRGLVGDGTMLEFNHMHANVLTQPDFDDQRYTGLNPYALGFAMMEDIRRICVAPTDEDREWFPAIAGCDDWKGVLKDAWADHRDDSFIQQFLSPQLIRKFRLFALCDDENDDHYTVTDIHDERGYRLVRERLARSYDIGCVEPNIQVVDVDLLGDRHLHLKHYVHNRIPLAEKSRDAVLLYIKRLWGYDVTITGRDVSKPDERKTVYQMSSTNVATNGADDD
jgi:stage V sporulation protein R